MKIYVRRIYKKNFEFSLFCGDFFFQERRKFSEKIPQAMRLAFKSWWIEGQREGQCDGKRPSNDV
jgi:hypothetical protein